MSNLKGMQEYMCFFVLFSMVVMMTVLLLHGRHMSNLLMVHGRPVTNSALTASFAAAVFIVTGVRNRHVEHHRSSDGARTHLWFRFIFCLLCFDASGFDWCGFGLLLRLLNEFCLKTIGLDTFNFCASRLSASSALMRALWQRSFSTGLLPRVSAATCLLKGGAA